MVEETVGLSGSAGSGRRGRTTHTLTSLDLQGNDIRDEGAKAIGKLTSLTSLDLYGFLPIAPTLAF